MINHPNRRIILIEGSNCKESAIQTKSIIDSNSPMPLTAPGTNLQSLSTNSCMIYI